MMKNLRELYFEFLKLTETNQAYHEILDEDVLEDKAEGQRSDKLRHQQQIRMVYFYLYNEHKRFPSITELEIGMKDKLGFSFNRATLSKHLREITKTDVSEMYKVFDPMVYDSLLYKILKSKDPKSIEVWFKYVSGLTANINAKVDIKGKVTVEHDLQLIVNKVKNMKEEEIDAALRNTERRLKLVETA